MVVCADGGANRLFDSLPSDRRSLFIPQYIKGDLDSLREDVSSFYRSHNTTILRDPDQDNNDLEKCLLLLENLSTDTSPMKVVVYGVFGGRFDQQMAAMHCLYRFSSSRVLSSITLLGDGNLAYLLRANVRHKISLTDIEGPGCSLLPLGGGVESITTCGLKWDLSGQGLRLGELISTSNQAVNKVYGNFEVDVLASHDVVWCCDVRL